MHVLSLDEICELDSWPLSWAGFGFLFSHSELQRIQKYDSRILDAFYAIEDNQVVGQCGVMRAEIRSREGIIPIGGVWGVCTSPRYAKRRIASHLLRYAHDFLQTKGFQLSFLIVSVNNIAYKMYKQFKYIDMCRLGNYTGQINNLARDESSQKFWSVYNQEEQKQTHNVFHEVTRETYGFTIRPSNFFQGQFAWNHCSPSDILLEKENGNIQGYAVHISNRVASILLDICVKDKKTLVNLFKRLKGVSDLRAEGRILIPGRLGRYMDNMIKNLGFEWQTTYETIMVKDITEDRNKDELMWLLGIDTENFRIVQLDLF